MQTLLTASSVQVLHLDMGPIWQEQQSNCSEGAQAHVALKNLQEIAMAMQAGGQETSTYPSHLPKVPAHTGKEL